MPVAQVAVNWITVHPLVDTALDDELPPMTYVFVVPNDSDLTAFLSFPAIKARLLRV